VEHAGGSIESLADGAALDDSTRSTTDRRQPRPSGTQEVLPIMSRRKPLTALAAVTAALALAVPVAGASASTTAPAARTASVGFGFRLPAGSLPCRIGIRELQFAVRTGNTVFANYIARVLQYSGCGGAAI
jgi:hypothetical protein